MCWIRFFQKRQCRWIIEVSLAIGTASSALRAQSEPPVLSWVRAAGGVGEDEAAAMVVSPKGELYLTGYFRGLARFSELTVQTAGVEDFFVAKYDPAGELMWVRRGGGVGRDAGRAIALDAQGNCYVTGEFVSTAQFGSQIIFDYGGVDIFVAKYDSDGVIQWVRSAGGPGVDLSNAISVDTHGNSFITGRFNGPAQFGRFRLPNSSHPNLFVAKYDASGNVLWAVDSNGDDRATGLVLAPDGDGGVFLAGIYPSFTGDDANPFVSRYGPSGNFRWLVAGFGPGDDRPTGLASDDQGNCYVTGLFKAKIAFGAYTLTNSGLSDVFLAKFDAASNPIWAISAGGPGADQSGGVTVDSRGDVWISGTFGSRISIGSITLNGNSSTTPFIARFDSQGHFSFAAAVDGTNANFALSVGVGRGGDAYLAGSTVGNNFASEFGGFAYGAKDIFVARWDPLPILIAERDRDRLRLSWPLFPPGFVLQHRSKMGSESIWSEIVEPLGVNSSTKVVSVPFQGREGFYRLHR